MIFRPRAGIIPRKGKMMEKSNLKGRAWLWIALLGALILAVFRELAFGGRIPVWMDPVTAFYPYSHYFAESVKSWEAPLWNPFIFSGYPFLADPQATVMYPFNWMLALILPAERLLGAKMALHFLIAGVFTFLFLRRLKCSMPAAFFGASAFTLSGALMPKIALPPVHQTTALIPLCFFAFSYLAEKPTLKRALACGLAAGLFLLSGYIQVVHFTLLCLLLYLPLASGSAEVKRVQTTRRKASAGRTLLLASGFFWLLTAFIAVTGGGRYSAGPLEISLQTTGNPAWLATIFLVSGWLLKGGRLKSPPRKIFKPVLMWAAAVFAGALIASPQLLPGAEFAALSTQRTDRTLMDIGSRDFLALMRDIAICDSDNFEEQTSAGTLPFLFAAAGAAGLLKNKRNSIPGFKSMAAVLVFSVLAVTGNFFVLRILRHIPGFLLFHHLGRNAALIAFPLAVLGALSADRVLGYITRQKYKTAAYAAVIVLSVAQLLHYSLPALKTLDPVEYFKDTDTTDFLRENAAGWRAFGLDEQRYSFDSCRDEGITRIIVPNTSMLLGIRDIQGYSPLQLERYNRYLDVMAEGRTDFYPYESTYHLALAGKNPSPLLDLLGARYAISEKPVDMEGFYPAADMDVKLYENRQALPRALVYKKFIVMPDGIETAELIHEGKVDPSAVVILAEEDLKHIPGLLAAAKTTGDSVQNFPVYEFPGRGGMPEASFTPHHIKIVRGAGRGPGLLFLNEIHYPGWEARVNGEPAPVIRANYLFRGVFVPEGKSTVEMRFRPRFFRLSMAGAGLTILAGCLMLIFGEKNKSPESYNIE